MHCCIFCEGRALRQQLRSHKWSNDAVAVTDAVSSSCNRAKSWYWQVFESGHLLPSLLVTARAFRLYSRRAVVACFDTKFFALAFSEYYSLMPRIYDCDCPSKFCQGQGVSTRVLGFSLFNIHCIHCIIYSVYIMKRMKIHWLRPLFPLKYSVD